MNWTWICWALETWPGTAGVIDPIWPPVDAMVGVGVGTTDGWCFTEITDSSLEGALGSILGSRSWFAVDLCLVSVSR